MLSQLRRSFLPALQSRRSKDESDGREPVGVRRIGALHDVEEPLLKLLRDRADGALADGAVVDLADRRDLRGGAREEALVREPQLIAGDATLADLELHLASERDD